MRDSEQEAQLQTLLGGKPDPKRKPGKPVLPLADTFDGAMAALQPLEAQFVRHVLAGDNYAAAYGKTHPQTKDQTRRNRGAIVAARKEVEHALALGRKAGALAAIAGLAYDIKAADTQLVQLIDEARESDQYSAVANLVRERLKLHKLTDATPAAMAGASFTLVIRAADGTEKTVTPGGHVIDVTPA